MGRIWSDDKARYGKPISKVILRKVQYIVLYVMAAYHIHIFRCCFICVGVAVDTMYMVLIHDNTV